MHNNPYNEERPRSNIKIRKVKKISHTKIHSDGNSQMKGGGDQFANNVFNLDNQFYSIQNDRSMNEGYKSSAQRNQNSNLLNYN